MLEGLHRLISHEKAYKLAPTDCRVSQKLSKRAFDQILEILDRAPERHKDYADCYIFDNLSPEQVKALTPFLVARKIEHRWIIALDYIKKSSQRAASEEAEPLG